MEILVKFSWFRESKKGNGYWWHPALNQTKSSIEDDGIKLTFSKEENDYQVNGELNPKYLVYFKKDSDEGRAIEAALSAPTEE
jgi:hypothetical protein